MSDDESKQADAIKRAFKFRRVPVLTVPEFADKYRRLSGNSSIAGPWVTSRVEVARGPMMAVTENGVKTITIMSCTQLLKTSLLENTIAFFATLAPCPILLCQPKAESVKAFSRERLVPMIKSSPRIARVFSDSDASDTIQYKEFSGGFLALESAGSPTNLAMRAIRVTLLDEIDKYETTKEGDPIILAEERSSTYASNALHIRTCSPTWVETSRIYKSYLESDQRKPFLKCPHCQFEFALDFFKHVQWPKTESGVHQPEQAQIFCADEGGCGAAWTEEQRREIMTNKGAIRWKVTRQFYCCGEIQTPELWRWDEENQVGRAMCRTCKSDSVVSNLHAGFTASKLYSPFITVPELVAMWIQNKDDPETKQTFYNTQLGQPFETQSAVKIEPHVLMDRREPYAAPVPFGVGLLTAGIDVQGGGDRNTGRLEIEVVGWGAGEESYSIDYHTIYGGLSDEATQQELEAYLCQQWQHESGNQMVIRAAAIDSGGHSTEQVYKFARQRLTRNVWAIKGASDVGGQWSPVWPVPQIKKGRAKVYGYKPIIIGSNAAKEIIAERLKNDQPGTKGYCHFPMNRPQAWFDQLTAETKVFERKHGATIRRWVLRRGLANEALDCRVYAYAALCGLLAKGWKIERFLAQIGTPFAPVPSPPTASALPIPDVAGMGTFPPVVSAPRPAIWPPKKVNRVRRSPWMA